jgi:agmatine/peptidylarginine deiminase
MHRILWKGIPAFLMAVLILAPAAAPAAENPESSIDRWEWDTDHIAKQLPQWETPEEREWLKNYVPPLRVNDPPPLAPLRNVGEYEPMTRALIRYPLGIPYAVIREMAENVQISCVVSSGNYNTARSNFQSNGVNPDAVDWILCASDSYWTRDYGPWFDFDGNGEIAIIDHKYNRPSRPNDDLVPIRCAEHWGIPSHTHDLMTTGGNYMTDGYGISFSTDLVWNENTNRTHQQIFDLMQDYYGLVTYNVVPDISTAGIHHIDCWAKLLDEETIIVKQVSSGHPDYPELEQNAILLSSLTASTGRNYRIVRVQCPSIGGTDVAGYTNSVILNKKVIVPIFGNTAADNAALQVYRDAMPGYEVLGFTGSWLTDDAVHCRVMGIPDFFMLRVEHTPVNEWHDAAPIPITARIDPMSGADVKADSILVYWRAYAIGNPPGPFHALVMGLTQTTDVYEANIPGQGSGITVDYYVHAVDQTNRREGMPRSEPAGWYTFLVTLPPADAADLGGVVRARLDQNRPNPFHPQTVFSFELKFEDDARLAVYDAEGCLVRTLVDGRIAAGRHEIAWDGRTDDGRELPAGTYFYRLQAAGVTYGRKALLVK